MFRIFSFLTLLLFLNTSLFADANDAVTNKQAKKIILVTGATGRQGGAVARELLKGDYHVRGFSRNPDSKRAKALSELGVEMVKGDFDDINSLNAAMKDAYGVFAVVSFWEHGYEKEVQHGKNIADVAKKNNVSHFIFSSVAHADEKTGVAHFDSKYEIELYIQKLGLRSTVFRPVSFMEGWEYARDTIKKGVISNPINADIPHQQISIRDIARFVALAFETPEKWIGRSLDIAAEQYSRKEITNIFSKITGSPVRYEQVSWEEYEKKQPAEMVSMQRWFEKTGYHVDIESLNTILPEMLSFEEYLIGAGWQELLVK